MKFCTDHGNITAVLCAKFRNNWPTQMDDVDEQVFVRIGLDMSFDGISDIATVSLENE